MHTKEPSGKCPVSHRPWLQGAWRATRRAPNPASEEMRRGSNTHAVATGSERLGSSTAHGEMEEAVERAKMRALLLKSLHTAEDAAMAALFTPHPQGRGETANAWSLRLIGVKVSVSAQLIEGFAFLMQQSSRMMAHLELAN